MDCRVFMSLLNYYMNYVIQLVSKWYGLYPLCGKVVQKFIISLTSIYLLLQHDFILDEYTLDVNEEGIDATASSESQSSAFMALNQELPTDERGLIMVTFNCFFCFVL